MPNEHSTPDQRPADHREPDHRRPEPSWSPAWLREDDRDPRTQGDRTRPPQPDGTAPLERDLPPVNQKR
jgi:hypothetical protein